MEIEQQDIDEPPEVLYAKKDIHHGNSISSDSSDRYEVGDDPSDSGHGKHASQAMVQIHGKSTSSCVSSDESETEDKPPERSHSMYNTSDDEDDEEITLDDESDDGYGDEEFVEHDPSGRYRRYSQILGKGATKTVYRAFDRFNCTEVAWCKASPMSGCDSSTASEYQAKSLVQEIHILKSLNHEGILKLYASWVNTSDNTVNLITELCSSSLSEFRKQHKHISKKAIKNWSRQILSALVHLHCQQPPVIHRDLKCDNILVKCASEMSLKIGDFGSSAQLPPNGHMHVLVGTPEFMAPEMFEEDYNELVDVYSFGMCLIELITREFPYSECKNLLHIYKNVVNHVKPKALLRIKDAETLRFINRCLLPASERPSAMELLSDPFLKPQESSGKDAMPVFDKGEDNQIKCVKNTATGNSIGHNPSIDPLTEAKLSADKSAETARSYRLMGRVVNSHTLGLRLRIQTSCASQDIVFPFDLRNDSSNDVAKEMVQALGYPETELVIIADLISKEVSALSVDPEQPQQGVSCGGGGVMDTYVRPHRNCGLGAPICA